jgi:hypothetical protein
MHCVMTRAFTVLHAGWVFSSFLLLGASSAFAGPIAPYYLSVGDSSGDTAWSKQYCGVLHSAITNTTPTSDTIECGTEKSKADALYHIEAVRGADHTIQLSVENWNPTRDETEFTRLSWNVAPGDETKQTRDVSKLVSRFVTYSNNQRLLKEWALAQGVQNSAVIKLDADGQYRSKFSGKVLDFPEAYKSFQYENPAQKHYLRATLELAGVLGLGVVEYFREVGVNSRDWALQYDWISLRRKFTLDAWEFDNNRYNTNALSHSVAGTIYYTTARSNHLSILESALFAFAGSTTWEFFAEYREKVSINDMIVTPMAGMAIGEVLHQLGSFLDRGDQNLFTALLGSIFGGPQKLHDWIDHNSPTRSGEPTTALGLSKSGWHEFKLYGGSGRLSGDTSKTSGMIQIGFQTEVINVPSYGREGEISKVLTDGNFTKLLVEATMSQGSVEDFKFFAQAALAGYYRQSIQKGAAGDLQGYSFFIGTGTALEYSLHDYAQGTPNAHSDKLTVVSVVGSNMELNLYLKGVHVRATLDMYADFAMLSSFAIDHYDRIGGDQSVLTNPMRNEQYYHAFGATITPRVLVEYKSFEIGAEAQAETFIAARFRDRNQDTLTNQIGNGDERARVKAWIAYNLPGDWAKLMVSVQKRYRMGYIGTVEDAMSETEAMGSLLILF